MKISSSIFCKHNNKKFIKIFHYKERPNYEKKFSINGKYERAFYQCTSCKHMYGAHKFNIKNLYSKQYLELTYKNVNGIHKRFKYVVKLKKSKSDNKNRAKRVDSFFSKKNLDLLDVGSGIGVFLYEMKKKMECFWNRDGQKICKLL